MVLSSVFCTLLSCCLRELAMEQLLNVDRGSGNAATFASFVLIAVEGFVNTTKFGSRKPSVPLSAWVLLVTMHFAVSVMNNAALSLYVAMPLHMIFRSGSLLASLLLNVVWLKRTYSLTKCISVVLVTLGIVICTLMSAKSINSDKLIMNDTNISNLAWWSLGVLMLAVALLISAAMGIVQEGIAAKYGRHPKEALFYTHTLPLPLFLLLSSDLSQHLRQLTRSPTTFYLPSGLVWLALYSLTQYLCVASVFRMTCEMSSISVTMVVTVRKFVSLIISVIYFGNHFTIWHTFGAILVFLGTILFSEVHKNLNFGKSENRGKVD